MNRTAKIIRIVSLAVGVAILASCGGGGGGSAAGGNASPSQVALVEVSSAGSSSIDVSWLPATDSTTPASEMKYQVHASMDQVYIPGSATLKAEVTGMLSTRLTGLQAATQYTIVLVAINATGLSAASTPLTVTTSALNSETTPGVVVATPTDIQIAAVTENQVTLTADAAAPQVGQFIASALGDGFLRQVTNVSTVSGQTVVETQPASLNQVVDSLEISSAFNMVSVPVEVAPTQVGVVVRSTAGKTGTAEWRWPQTNFRLSSTPVKRRAGSAQVPLQLGVTSSGASNMDVSSKTVSSVGNWATFVGPDTIGILTGTSGEVSLNLDVTHDDSKFIGGARIPIAICKVEINSAGAAPGLVTVGVLSPTETEMVDGYSAIRRATQGVTINAAGVAARAEPYVVTLRAYIDEADNHCQGSWRFFLGWKETLDITINVAVVSTPNFPQSESKALEFSGNFNVKNDVTFTFDPTLEAEVRLHKSAGLIPGVDYARLETKSRAALAQKLTVTATGAGTIDSTRTLIEPRKFVKVYMAGTVPIVMSGEFAADLRVQGNVTGALVATEELKFNLEDMKYGLVYENGAWTTTQGVRPAYQLKLSGTGDAEAHLTVSLLPRLSVKFYEAASGRLVVSPYLQADAGVHGQVLADITPSGTTTDADYWLTQGKLSGGIDAYVMADLTIWDRTFLKWPGTANIDDYTTFRKLPLIPGAPVVIAGLPSLSATYDSAARHPTDSRAYLVKGRAANVANPFKSLYGGPDSFLPFASWTTPKVIALNGTGYSFVAAPADSDPGDVWVAFTNAGNYTVRVGGNSAMGGWARQVAEVAVVVTDSNNNGIIDQWEVKYGLLGSGVVIAAADPDADGYTNLQEFQRGSNPVVADAIAQPVPGQTVVITQVLDDVGASTGALAQGATTDDATPSLSGTLSATLSAGQTVKVFSGSTILGTAAVSGTTWSFTPAALAAGSYSFTAAVVNAGGLAGTPSSVWALVVDVDTVPGQTVVITQVLDDVGASTGALAQGATTDDATPSLSGTLSAPLSAGQTVTVFGGSTILGTAAVSGTTWSFTPAALAAGSYSFTAAVVNAGGLAGTPSSVWALVVDTAVTPPVAGSEPLNDTGIDWCADGATNFIDCLLVDTLYAGQDGQQGRDAQARAGALVKVGGGSAGFDFTKLDANGSPLAIQGAAWSDAGSEIDGTKWSCVKDNHTGLIWEMKNNDATSLHYSGNAYTWYNTDAMNNGGFAGYANGGTCTGSNCDTESFAAAVNAQGLCGANDWRVPSERNLSSIVDFSRINPSIDTDYFPNTVIDGSFWSSSPYASYGSNHAWVVGFSSGGSVYGGKDGGIRVRLVRAGQ